MKALLVAVIVFMAGGLYYTLFYPPSVMKRQIKDALAGFDRAVETQDRAQVAETLSRFLADDAHIRLDVVFSSISQANVRPMSQDFDKAAFLTFIDNILYTVSDYHFHPRLENFTAGDSAATVTFVATQWADGPSFYSGVSTLMRFSGDTQCSGEVVFIASQPTLKSAQCAVLLRSVAKADSTADMLNRAQQIQQLQMQQR